jgi:hypothetical protein
MPEDTQRKADNEWPGPDGRDLMGESIDLLATGRHAEAIALARESNRRLALRIEARQGQRSYVDGLD